MKRTDAFSLIELSIVLVILGLLTGGILAGKSLIRASELRSVLTQKNNFHTAVLSFRDKYFALPGDIANATAFWGAASGTTGRDAACRNALPNDTSKTCNGGGNGMIDNQGGAINEQQLIWNHLANAGLIEGSYGTPLSIDARAPSSEWASCYTDRGMYGRGYANMLMLAQKDSGSSSMCFMRLGAAIMGNEAWNLDQKSDDGKPGTGKMTAEDGFSGYTGCTNAGSTWDDTSADYALTSSQKNCRLFWPLTL
jgi:prepilin-type N-terminal cleavage/methylation domain-containing protein